MDNEKLVLLIFILIVLLFIAMKMEYHDEVNAEKMYTEMVCTGIWPDYKEIKPLCTDTTPVTTR
jgi:hypothetical protein